MTKLEHFKNYVVNIHTPKLDSLNLKKKKIRKSNYPPPLSTVAH